MTLLPVSHRRQKQQADCLAVCAAMVLDYWHVPITYKRLARLLRVDAIGAPFRNLRHLRPLGLSILIEEGNLQALRGHLENGWPPIVAVDTAQLPYWDEATDHAVVVVGMDEQQVYINDPNTGDSPQIVSLAEFELAWLEKDYLYAVIRPE
ncbi:MAG: peptidase C39 family protein [Chloroflexi bacterium]|nr:peptidase C39 family protein [Chloroflexota bacterium]MCI0646426.1 peptidase C39 family protein [Chloroflexota bacterium]MCI0730186.1 peptidase C39 family protein [Chloroflexota bacterium]